jgi:hypothetical protein
MSTKMKISDIRHPIYNANYREWNKWRYAYEGGEKFVDMYLQKLSRRESDADFEQRKTVSYCPGFAASAVDEIKNSIYQRMSDVVRAGGPESYKKAITNGVDLDRRSMRAFMGTDVLKELLVMGRVGVLVDQPSNLGVTVAEKGDKHPYLGVYPRECILSWSYVQDGSQTKLKSLLLQEYVDTIDGETDLPCASATRYRYMQLTPQGVKVVFYDSDSEEVSEMSTTLELTEIPFVSFDIPRSLMKNISEMQVALMNLESSDITFACKANFPFYYEFYEPKSEMPYMKQPGYSGDGTSASTVSKDKDIVVGATQGRRFPAGTEKPGFINPSPESLIVSMQKEEQLKSDIRRLVNLNLTENAQSGKSKREDTKTLEGSLSFIGLVLEQGENAIGRIWTEFEGGKQNPKISYPKTYDLKTPTEKNEEIDTLTNQMEKIPSDTFKRFVAKKIANLVAGCEMTEEEVSTVMKEIDNADTLTSDPDQIIADHEAGLVDDETASKARGYKKGVVEQARKDRAERIKLTMEAQGGPQGDGAARGAADFGGKTGSDEKVGKPKRGADDKVKAKREPKT